MKKNVMMRVASALLVAVLMTTCAISGTFAKYTTSKTGSDSARVAKWGVEITANGQTFAKSEEGTVNSVTANTVLSTENVVAPGMKGSMAKMTIAGAPEVAVKVTYAANLELANWEVNSAYYCPIVIKVGATEYKGASYSSMAEFETAVENAINAYTAEYAAGVNLDANTAAAPDVSWSWAYYVDDATDEKDTKLAATGATIALTVVTTVTQVD